MTTPFKGKYTNFNNFSLKKRFYLMQAQRNTPLLDEEVRELSQTSVLLTNWLARNSYGELAVLSYKFSEKDGVTNFRNLGFRCGPVNPANPQDSANSGNFKIFGGNNSNGLNDFPAVMYIKGWYAFLSSDILYSEQNGDPDQGCDTVIKEYPSEVIPSLSSSIDQKLRYALRNDTFTKMSPAAISSGYVGQKDVVYVEITFDEVTSSGNSEEYVDPSLKDPVVASNTANRVRASMSFLVKEKWTGSTNGSIFEDPFFQSGTYDTGVSYVRAPISLITRTTNSLLVEGDFQDLLDLHDKRVYPSEEITHRLRHGGYTPRDVLAERALPSDVDERWGATGLNEGLATEAYNSSSVTPRVLSKTSDFRIQSLAVAGITGPAGMTGYAGTIQPDANGLIPGEVTTDKSFSDKTFVRGNDLTTIEKARDMLQDTMIVMDATGLTGHAGQTWHTSDKKVGDPTVATKASAWQQVFHENGDPNGNIVSELDYKGRLALGKKVDPHGDYYLDVAGKSNFDENVDMRGDNNQVWKDFGVSGTASIFNLEVDRQSFMFQTLLRGAEVPPPFSRSNYKFWKVCSVALTEASRKVSFTVSAVSHRPGVKSPIGSFNICLETQASMADMPLSEVVIKNSHEMVKESLRVKLAMNSSGLKLIEVYIGMLPCDSYLGWGVDEYNTKDTTGINLTNWGEFSGVIWTEEVDISPLDLGTISYERNHFRAQKTERYSYNELTSSISPTNYKLMFAKRPVLGTTEGRRVNQAFILNALAAGPEPRVRLGSYRIQVFADVQGKVKLSVTDAESSVMGDISVTKITSLMLGDNSYQWLGIEFSYGEFPQSLVLEVSEDPMQGEGYNLNPFRAHGFEDVPTSCPSYPNWTDEHYWSEVYVNVASPSMALATSANIGLRGTASLELCDKVGGDMYGGAIGETGTAAPTILDKFGSKGSVGMVLTSSGDGSLLGEGVVWKRAGFYTVPNIEALRAMALNCGADEVYLEGYYTPGDGGGGFFLAKDSTSPDDGGVTIRNSLSSSKAWIRQVPNNVYNIFYSGAIPWLDNTNQPGTRDTEIASAIAIASSFQYSLLIATGSVYKVTGDITFPESTPLTIEGGVFFYYEGGTPHRPVISFLGSTTVNTYTALTHPTFGPVLNFTVNALTEVRAEWWYAAADSSYDSTTAFLDMYRCLSLDASGNVSTGGKKGISVILGKHEEAPVGTRTYKITDTVHMTSPTIFTGGATITLEGNGQLYVQAGITAPNKKIFVLNTLGNGHSGSSQYYCVCSDNSLLWDLEANPNINVTWFGMVSGDTLPNALANSQACTLLNTLFRCLGNKAVLFFPIGDYHFRASYGSIDLGKTLLDMAPGALLVPHDTPMLINGFVGGSSAKFYFDPADDTLENTFFPVIASGDLKVEWFRGDACFEDSWVIRCAIGSLLMSTNVLEDPDVSEDKTDWVVRWLDGEGNIYDINESFHFSAGMYNATQNLYFYGSSIKSMTWRLGDGVTIGTSDISMAGTWRVTKVENWLFRDILFVSRGTSRINLIFASDTVMSGCRFIGGMTVDSIGSYALSYSSVNVGIANCTFDNSRVQLSSGSIIDCTFNATSAFTDFLAATSSLYQVLTSGSVTISGNRFLMVNSATNILAKCLSLGQGSGNPIVNGNYFENGRMSVYNGSGVSITNNSFRALNYTPRSFPAPPDTMEDALDTFILLSGSTSTSGVACYSMIITGNKFYEKNTTTVLAGDYSDTEGSTFMDRAIVLNFQAIGITPGTYYDNKNIWDVVVKDNVGTRGVNIKATELTDIRYVPPNSTVYEGIAPTGSYACPGIVGMTEGGGGYPSNYFMVNRRLFGNLQPAISVGVCATNLSAPTTFKGVILGSAYVGMFNDVWSPWVVAVTHMPPGGTSWEHGLPANFHGVISVTYRTYQPRMGSMAMISESGYHDPTIIRAYFNLNGETL